MTEPIFQGYTFPEVKVCSRCHGINVDPLYELCLICRGGDALVKWIDEHCQEDELWKDEQYTREVNRP